jgi:1-acyl-sn-glycerol-3-phosphate acyltransferase
MNAIRSALFMAYVIVWSTFSAPLVVIAGPLLGGIWAYRFGKLWRLGTQWGVENLLGIRANIIGRDNMPAEPCVIMAKHQSAWETMTLQDCVPNGAFCVFVLKKELLKLPLVGWGLAAMKMISIDRAAGKNALDQVVTQGRERLKQGFYVIIFPEGTRVPPGEKRRYKPGGAYLATHVGCKVVTIAHDPGELCPRQAFLKNPGTVTISIGPAFDASGMSDQEVNQRVEQWIEAEMRRLSPHRYTDAAQPA